LPDRVLTDLGLTAEGVPVRFLMRHFPAPSPVSWYNSRSTARFTGRVPMNVFISWSGAVSRQIAKSLYDWLPTVLQSVQPFMSAEDIEKGARWLSEITTELETSHFGVICLTPDNLSSTWIHFEAGSLAKIVDRSNVVPILFNVEPSHVQGPLTQFQMANFAKDEMYRLLGSINNAAGESRIPDPRLERTFDMFWPQLNAEIERVDFSEKRVSPRAASDKFDDGVKPVLEEILVLVRNLSIDAAGLNQITQILNQRTNAMLHNVADPLSVPKRKETLRLRKSWSQLKDHCQAAIDWMQGGYGSEGEKALMDAINNVDRELALLLQRLHGEPSSVFPP